VKKRSKISPEDQTRILAHQRYKLVFQIETLISEFTAQRSDLDQHIKVEEARSKQTDPAHYAYSPLAASLRVRVENLHRSIAELTSQLGPLKDQSESIQPIEAGNFDFRNLVPQERGSAEELSC
jgi:hypothetical protein